MIRLYIIVQVNNMEQQMITRNSEREVIAYAGIMGSRSGLDDDIEIKRIFSVNEWGKVQHHSIEFKNGKLILEQV